MTKIPRTELSLVGISALLLIGLPTLLPITIENPLGRYWAGVALSLLPLLLASILLIRRYGNPIRADLTNLQKDGFTVWGGLLGLWSLAGVTSYLILQIGQKAGNQTAPEAASQSVALFAIVVIGSALVVAPIEELFFRGIIHSSLSNHFGMAPAIVLSSLFFSIAHIWTVTGTPTGKLLYFSFLFGQGAIYAAVYERTDNLYAAIALHGLYNVTIKLLAL